MASFSLRSGWLPPSPHALTQEAPRVGCRAALPLRFFAASSIARLATEFLLHLLLHSILPLIRHSKTSPMPKGTEEPKPEPRVVRCGPHADHARHGFSIPITPTSIRNLFYMDARTTLLLELAHWNAIGALKTA